MDSELILYTTEDGVTKVDVTFVVNDWFVIHKANDFLGNSRRIFTKGMCNFVKPFVLI